MIDWLKRLLERLTGASAREQRLHDAHARIEKAAKSFETLRRREELHSRPDGEPAKATAQ